MIERIIYILAFFPLAIPLYIDLSTWQLMLPRDSYELFYVKYGVPMPIGAISVMMYYVYGNIRALVQKDYMYILEPRIQRFVVVSMVAFIYYVQFISGLPLTRAIQLVLPLVFISGIVYPVDKDKISTALYSFLFGCGSFVVLHLCSIVLYSSSWPPDRLGFLNFFGVYIYSGLVSYPGVLYVCAATAAFLVYRNIVQGSAKVLSVAIFIMTLLLLIIAARKISLIHFTSMMVVFVLPYFGRLLWSPRLFLGPFNLLLLVILVGVVSYLMFGPIFPIFSRMDAADSLDSNRSEIWLHALNVFGFLWTYDYTSFLFGVGGGGAPGLHNYAFDTFYRVGLFGLVFLFSLLLYTFNQMIGGLVAICGADGVWYTSYVVVMLLALIFDSSINVAITQPYYFVNWLFVLYLVLLYKPSFA